MMPFWKFVVFLALLSFGLVASSQDLVINEVMSNNNLTIQDIDGDYSDWIEVYNTSSESINLSSFHLSDDADNLSLWQLPDMLLMAHDHLLIFASGKNLFGAELHTNFSISKNGETLYLSSADAEVVDFISPIWIGEDESYARITDGHRDFVHTPDVTPGAENEIYGAILNGYPSGFYNEPFFLELNSQNATLDIRFTTDGKDPTNESPIFSALEMSENVPADDGISFIPTTPLEGPYPLSTFIWKTPELVNTCHVIKYASFLGENRVSDVFVKTYFIGENEYSYKVVSLVTDSMGLFGYDEGIYVPGRVFDEEGFDWFPKGNFLMRGEEWERRVHLTMFDSDKKISLESEVGVRIRGNGSTSNPQKSLNVYFRKEYGLKHIHNLMFSDSLTEVFKRFILRSSGNDFLKTHFKDAVLQRIIQPLDLDLQAFTPVILFVNGEYWGIHNIREKLDDFHLENQFGADADSVNLLGVCGSLEAGSKASYTEVSDYMENNDMTTDAAYDYVAERVDLTNFIDYNIAEIYFANYDWPCNNYKIWKKNEPGSKWRFLIYDLDLSTHYKDYSSPETLSMDHATRVESGWPHCSCSSLFFRKLLLNDRFKREFLDRFAYCQEHIFNPERVNGHLTDFQNLFSPEMEEHIKRWGYPSSVSAWEEEVDVMRNFFEVRPCVMENNIKSFFSESDYDFDCLNKSKFDGQNELVIYPNPGSGEFKLVNNSTENFENASLKIIDSRGRTVLEPNLSNLPSFGVFEFNGSTLNTGVYTVLISDSNKRTTARFVKY